MERATLAGHQAALRGVRDTIGGMTGEASAENIDRLASCVEGLAAVVQAFVEERLTAGAPATKVGGLMGVVSGQRLDELTQRFGGRSTAQGDGDPGPDPRD